MKAKLPIRNGDVLLKPIQKLPKGVKELKDKTLAYGEATGHSHRFENPDNIERYEADGRLYLQVFQPSTIIHEEHNPLIILPGVYEQITEREYDPFIESARTIVD